mmetsp:Transcript_25490/g.55815  ORF Transcript_25490/g.55815 Transcript_25490/m.55815 type:complete len:392 (-) Transcript_25490:64-1239(-)
MLSQIRAFEAERQEWDEQRDALVKERVAAEKKAAELAEEVKQLRDGGGGASVGQSAALSPVDLDKSLRAHHAQTVKLMATIDELRTVLQQEQSKSKLFEQSNADLERRAVAAERELTRLKDAAADIDVTATDFGSSSLDISLRAIPAGSSDAHSLEEENLKLREELNATKKKVIELKQVAQQRKLAWKGELANITQELDAKRRLEEEVLALRQQMNALSFSSKSAEETITRLRQQVEKLQEEILQAKSTEVVDVEESVAHKAREMEIMNIKVSEQLVSVEQELTRKLRRSAELWEHFLLHIQEPLAAIRRWAQTAAASGNAGRELWMKRAPPMYCADVRELKSNLGAIVEILRYCEDVLTAYQPHGPEGSVMSRLEESTEQAKEWLKSVVF